MNSQELIEIEHQYLLQTYRRQPVVLVRGEGSYVYDIDGKRYLDFMAGIAVLSLGHSHPIWVKAVQEQAASLVHVSNIYYTVPMIELAKDLCELSGMDRVFFCNSGTEANEVAIKIARKWGKKKRGSNCYKIIGVLSNNPDAAGLAFAAEAGIPALAVSRGDYPSLSACKTAIFEKCRDLKPDLIALAGFMQIIQPEFAARDQ